jgi:hypothetical protein
MIIVEMSCKLYVVYPVSVAQVRDILKKNRDFSLVMEFNSGFCEDTTDDQDSTMSFAEVCVGDDQPCGGAAGQGREEKRCYDEGRSVVAGKGHGN